MELITKENGNLVWKMVKEQWYMLQEISMKVIGKILNEMEKAWWCGKLHKKNTQAIGMTDFNQDLELISGLKVLAKINFFETDMLAIGRKV